MAAVPAIGRATRVESTAAPEADATRTLYERYGNQIFGYCLHQLGSREEAEDAVQSTFLNAFRGLTRGVVPEAEQAWLFKIAHNVCLSRRRSTWRRGRVESPSDFELAEETTAAPHRRADELIGLQDVLENMPENQRRAILLREWQGLSYREIAEELELSQAAVETLIFRARRALASGLEASPAEQRSWRVRVRSSLDLGSLAAWLKSFLVSGVAVKAAGTAAVVTVASAVVAIPQEHTNPRATPKPAQTRAPARAAVWAPSPVSLAPARVEATAPVDRPDATPPAARTHEHAARAAHVAARPAAPAPAAAAPPASAPEQPPAAPAPPAPATVVEAPRSETAHATDGGNGDARHEHARAGGGGKGKVHRDLAGPAATPEAAHRGADAHGAQKDAAQVQHGRNRDERSQAQPAQPSGHRRQQQQPAQTGQPAGARAGDGGGHGEGAHDQGGHGHGQDEQAQAAGNAAGSGNGSGHESSASPQAPTTPSTATTPSPDPSAAPADDAHDAGSGHNH